MAILSKDDMKKAAHGTTAKSKAPTKTMLANFPGLVDLCTDENGKVAYLVKRGDTAVIEHEHTINGNKIFPPDMAFLPFKLPRGLNVLNELLNQKRLIQPHKTRMDKGEVECVESVECFQGTGRGGLLNEVTDHLKIYSYLPEGQMLMVGLYVFLTYLQDHKDIHYLPMILFYAVPERGKSRTGKAATLISYRGVHCVDIREANLFRYVENLRATLFIDVMDLWRKTERSGSEDILLLRYEKGAKATRVLYPEKGAFKDTVFYDVYGPTYIATNEAVHKILDTRCIPITMPNKPGRYENPTPDKAQELKERLTAWRALTMDSLLPSVEPIEGIQGRLWDICSPLLSVCKLIAPERYGELINELLRIAGQRAEDKKDSIEGQIVEALYALSLNEHGNEWMIKTSDAADKVNEKRAEGYKVDSRYIGKKVKALGLRTALRNKGYSYIELEREAFDTLCRQYGITEKGRGEPVPCNHSTDSTHSTQAVMTRVLGVECGVEREKKDPSHSTEPPKKGNSNGCGLILPKCGNHDMKYRPETQNLMAWCLQNKNWCPQGH